MLKLVVVQPGQPDWEVLVQGDSATVGRAATCDVVIDRPFISKQHLRILRGTVAHDLGSSNGTFLDGRKLTEAVLLQGKALTLGQNGVELHVHEQEPSDETRPAAASAEEVEVEQVRSQFVLLEAELAELKRDLARARSVPAEQESVIARLKGENASLRDRVDSLKGELEGREVDDGDSIQAKLAMQRVEGVKDLNEGLQREVDRLRAEVAELEAARAAPAEQAAAAGAGGEASGAELEALRSEAARLRGELATQKAAARTHADQTELVRKLRKELEGARAAAPKPAGNPEQELERSRAEVVELRARAAELEGRLAAAPTPQERSSDLFFKLQSENSELRRKLAALEKGAGSPAASAPREPRQVKELMEARLRIAALESELAKLSAVKAAPPPPPPTKSARAAQVERPAASERPAAGGCDVRRVLTLVVEKDIEGLPRASGGLTEEFVMVESLRLLRQVERVVTRIAGDLIQLFRLQTMLPDTTGTYRDLVSALLSGPDDAAARARLSEYLETLGRWLVAGIGAHRKAAVLFATRIKEDLSEKSLTAREPLPPYARVPMLAGGELWRRAQGYLQALSPDTIDERINDLARAQAQSLLNEAP